jgi:RNA-directed DNA polymerase
VGLPQPPRKPKRWIVRRYFGRFNPSRRNNWVFGDAASGAYLPLMAWTPIIRHRKVTGRASPDDPALTAYWSPAGRLYVPRIASTALTSRVARPTPTRDDHRSCACGSPSS